MDRRKFLTILGVGAAISALPLGASAASADTGASCGAVSETTTIYFLNSNWGNKLYPAPDDHTACKGKACHFRNANTFYSSAKDAENSRLHICCIAPVQSRTIALSAADIATLKNGNISFDIRNAQTLVKLKEIIAEKNCTTPSNVTKSMVTSVLSTVAVVTPAAETTTTTTTPATGSAQGTLPFTGSKDASKLSLYGLSLASLGLIFTLRTRRKKEPITIEVENKD